MKLLSYRAAREFLDATKLSYFAGFVSWTEAMDRLVALCQMCSTKNPSGQAAARILRVEQWPSDANWPDGVEAQNHGDESAHRPSSVRRRPGATDDEDDEPPYLYFLPASVTGLGEWEFHQYDDDYHPAIPHGHWHGMPRPKLDPYQGWVYAGSIQVRREPRSKIIALWNDAKFRDFARTAIQYYLDHYPHYTGWRVSDPLRIPRCR